MQTNTYCLNKVCYFYDPPFISALDQKKIQKITCQYCNQMIYCSEDCRIQDWNKQHRERCLENPENQPPQEEDQTFHSKEPSLCSSTSQPFKDSLNQFEIHSRLQQMFEVSDKLLEDFEIIVKDIGQGTYGKVSLVRDVKTNQIYAMKIIQKACLQEMTTSQLSREIHIQKKLEHQNILRLYYFFQDRDFIHMVLEYAENGAISKLIKNNIDEIIVWNYFLQICLGINYLHQNNVIHRDLKPENILLTKDNLVKLCDFGWSTEVENPSSIRDTICGTIDYMAPEMILQTNGYGTSVDIWSLGIILYELLNGQVPFKGQDLQQFIDLGENNLKMTNPMISNEAQDLINNLLKIDPAESKTSLVYTFSKMQIQHYLQFKEQNYDLTHLQEQIIQNDASLLPLSNSTVSRQVYFDIDGDFGETPLKEERQLKKNYIILLRSQRNTNISLDCLDQYLRQNGLDNHANLNIFNQLNQQLALAEKKIQKCEDLDKGVKVENSQQPFQVENYKQIRLSRISIRNNIRKRDEDQQQIQTLQQKSFINKLAEVFGCVNREKTNG